MDPWLQDAKEQLTPISAMLEKLQQEREELVVRRRQKQDEGQEKVGCVLHLSPFVPLKDTFNTSVDDSGTLQCFYNRSLPVWAGGLRLGRLLFEPVNQTPEL